ncbi:hypothetical protein ACLOJK_000361 [Asimina triloba]
MSKMGMKRTMLPVKEVDISSVEYQREVIKAPHLTGYALKFFAWLVEIPFIGSLIMSLLKWQNNITEMMQHTVIPEPPMYLPEFPPQEVEPAVVLISEDTKPSICVESALDCLLPYDPNGHWTKGSPDSFLYWTIRDYAYAYQSKAVTPSIVAERLISSVEESDKKEPPMKLMISFIAEDVRKQAAASTKRFEEEPQGIHTQLKDIPVAHPQALQLLLLLDYAQLLLEQMAEVVTLCDGTVEVVSPLAATVEDVMLVYAAMTGSSPADIITLNPLGSFEVTENRKIFRGKDDDALLIVDGIIAIFIEDLVLQTFDLFFQWFDDVYSTDISTKCNDALNLITTMYGCQVTEIVLPELLEMSNSLLVSMGGEFLSYLSPDLVAGNIFELTCDSKIDLALFRSFTASEYVSAQQLRRRVMYYHLEAFKKVDVIVTPTTGSQQMSDFVPFLSLDLASGYLMRFVAAGNLLGLPAISVPVGHDKQGLPIGLQLIGRPWGEATILRLAYAVEELCFKFRNRPSIFYDILGVRTKNLTDVMYSDFEKMYGG